jgi:hypothetical protein
MSILVSGGTDSHFCTAIFIIACARAASSFWVRLFSMSTGECGMLSAWNLVTGKPILVWAAHHDAITALDWIVRACLLVIIIIALPSTNVTFMRIAIFFFRFESTGLGATSFLLLFGW